MGMADNGFYTMIPFLAQIVSKNGFHHGFPQKKSDRMGHTAAAKFAQTLARCTTLRVGASVSLLMLLLFADCTRPGLALLTLTFCCGLHSCMAVGFFVSMLQICPPLTGIIVSIVVACGTTAAGLSTVLMGVVSNNPYKYELVFGLCIALNIIAGLVYLAWAEVQPWAGHLETNAEKKETKVIEEAKEFL